MWIGTPWVFPEIDKCPAPGNFLLIILSFSVLTAEVTDTFDRFKLPSFHKSQEDFLIFYLKSSNERFLFIKNRSSFEASHYSYALKNITIVY